MKPNIYAIIFGLYLLLCSPASHAIFIDHNTYTTDTASGRDWLDVTQTVNISEAEITALLSPGGAYAQWRIATGDEFNMLVSDFMGSAVNTYNPVVWDNKIGELDPNTFDPSCYRLYGYCHGLAPPDTKLSSLQDLLGRTTDACWEEGGIHFHGDRLLLTLGYIADTNSAGTRFKSEISVTEYIEGQFGGYIYTYDPIIDFLTATSTTHTNRDPFFPSYCGQMDCLIPTFPGYYLVRDTQVANIPEPAPILLMLAGLFGFAFRKHLGTGPH